MAIALRPRHLIVCWITSDLRFGPQIPPELQVRTGFSNPIYENRSIWSKPLVSLFPSRASRSPIARTRGPANPFVPWGTWTSDPALRAPFFRPLACCGPGWAVLG